MRSLRLRTPALVAVGALAASLIAIGIGAEAKSSSRPSGGKAVAHRDGRAVAAGNVPVAETFSVGGHALEPTLGIDPGGDIFYAAAGFDSIGGEPGTQILRSTDGAETWKNMSPRVLGQNTMPISLDPYVWVDDRLDGDSSRVYTIDLTLACSYMSFSDDDGQSWITNPLSCGRPVNDHQTLFSGPPVTSTTVGYPNIVYYCWNDVGSSSCSKSLDGGITFHPTGTPAFEGYDPQDEEEGFDGVSGFCGGLHGHGHVAEDGTLYLPRDFCHKPMLAISNDEGLTWERVLVAKMRSTSTTQAQAAGLPSITTDKKGNVYYLFIGEKDRLPYLTVSRDGGKKWSKPMMIGAPGLNETNLPQIEARGVGKVGIVYYGSTNSPFHKCNEDCDDRDYLKTTWNGYMTISANVLDKNPVFYTGLVNDPKDPLIRRECGPGRCHWAYDFIDVEIGPDGIAYGAFVDGCMKNCTELTPREGDYEGLVMKLVGGPSLN